MTEPLDLDSCAQEPIRIPGGIQPHGALLVVAPDGTSIRQASANSAALLGLDDTPRSMTDLPAGKPDLAAEIERWEEAEDPFFLRSYRTEAGPIFQVS